jgi:hypothetical protein
MAPGILSPTHNRVQSSRWVAASLTGSYALRLFFMGRFKKLNLCHTTDWYRWSYSKNNGKCWVAEKGSESCTAGSSWHGKESHLVYWKGRKTCRRKNRLMKNWNWLVRNPNSTGILTCVLLSRLLLESLFLVSPFGEFQRFWLEFYDVNNVNNLWISNFSVKFKKLSW